jgi:hypothetical protein
MDVPPDAPASRRRILCFRRSCGGTGRQTRASRVRLASGRERASRHLSPVANSGAHEHACGWARAACAALAASVGGHGSGELGCARLVGVALVDDACRRGYRSVPRVERGSLSDAARWPIEEQSELSIREREFGPVRCRRAIGGSLRRPSRVRCDVQTRPRTGREPGSRSRIARLDKARRQGSGASR